MTNLFRSMRTKLIGMHMKGGKKMKNVRTKLAKSNPYYISDYRRKELKYFCLQYKEKISYLNSIEIGRGQTEWDDPTGETAIKRVIYERDIKIITETAKLSGEEIWEFLFKAYEG